LSPIEFLSGFQKFAYALKTSRHVFLGPEIKCCFLRIQVSTKRVYSSKKKKERKKTLAGFSLLIAGRTKTTPALNKIPMDYFKYHVV